MAAAKERGDQRGQGRWREPRRQPQGTGSCGSSREMSGEESGQTACGASRGAACTATNGRQQGVTQAATRDLQASSSARMSNSIAISKQTVIEQILPEWFMGQTAVAPHSRCCSPSHLLLWPGRRRARTSPAHRLPTDALPPPIEALLGALRATARGAIPHNASTSAPKYKKDRQEALRAPPFLRPLGAPRTGPAKEEGTAGPARPRAQRSSRRSVWVASSSRGGESARPSATGPAVKGCAPLLQAGASSSGDTFRAGSESNFVSLHLPR